MSKCPYCKKKQVPGVACCEEWDKAELTECKRWAKAWKAKAKELRDWLRYAENNAKRYRKQRDGLAWAVRQGGGGSKTMKEKCNGLMLFWVALAITLIVLGLR